MGKYATGPTTFGTVGKIITPGNSDIAGDPKAVSCLTAGNLTIVPVGNGDSETLAYVGVGAGFSPPFRVRRVTAATAVVATVEG
jgi:hypothetical protein